MPAAPRRAFPACRLAAGNTAGDTDEDALCGWKWVPGGKELALVLDDEYLMHGDFVLDGELAPGRSNAVQKEGLRATCCVRWRWSTP
jgi:hypothetical protein